MIQDPWTSSIPVARWLVLVDVNPLQDLLMKGHKVAEGERWDSFVVYLFFTTKLAPKIRGRQYDGVHHPN